MRLDENTLASASIPARLYAPGLTAIERFVALHPAWEVRADEMEVSGSEIGALLDKCRSDDASRFIRRVLFVVRHGGIAMAPQVEVVANFASYLSLPNLLVADGAGGMSPLVVGGPQGDRTMQAFLDAATVAARSNVVSDISIGSLCGLLADVAAEHRAVVVPPEVFVGHARTRHSCGVVAAVPPSPKAKSASRTLAGIARRGATTFGRLSHQPERANYGCYVGDDRVLVSTTEGFPLIAAASDRSLTPQLVTEGWYDTRLANFMRSRLRPGDWFVDIGGNIGLFSVFGAASCRAVGPRCLG